MVVLGLSILGFPDFLTRWILADINSGDYFVQAHDVYLDLRGGLNARNVRVYRKGLPGPPFLEARECRVLYYLFDRPRAGRSRVKELKIYDGMLRPIWSSACLGSKRNSVISGGMGLEGQRSVAFKEIGSDVSLFNFDVLGVWVEQVKATVQINAGGGYLSRISGKVGREIHSGSIDGALAWRQDGQLTGQLTTSFDPRALIPVCKMIYPEAVGVLDRFSFPVTPPRMDFTFEIGSKPAISVVAKGRIQAANYAYRGAMIGFASMNVDVASGNGTNRLKVDPFSLTIGGLHARGMVDFDFIAGVADFQARSEINLATVLRLVGLRESLMEHWNFEESARLVAKGHIGYTHPENSEVEAMVEGSKIGFRGITFNNYSFNYKNRGFHHTFSDFRGNMGGGFIGGSADLLSDKSGSHWTADIKAEIINADTDELVKLVSTNLEWRMGGKIFGNLEVGGIGTELVGQGQMTIRNARIFNSPIGLSLSEHWGNAARSLDLADIPAEARFTFELNHNKIQSRDLFLETENFGLEAQGSCGLDGSLDWVLKPVTTKNSNAMERVVMALLAPQRQAGYSLTGTFAKPEWRPIPRP